MPVAFYEAIAESEEEWEDSLALVPLHARHRVGKLTRTLRGCPSREEDSGREQMPFRQIVQQGLVTTEHLRATIRQTESRIILIRAYLTDLDWAGELLRRASDVVARLGEPTGLPDDTDRHPGGTWYVEGKWFYEVSVDELALIEIIARWNHRKLPNLVESLSDDIERILNQLDHPLVRPT